MSDLKAFNTGYKF